MEIPVNTPPSGTVVSDKLCLEEEEATTQIAYYLARCQLPPNSIQLDIVEKLRLGKQNCLAFLMVKFILVVQDIYHYSKI
jgi:hypothetical protein